MSSTGRGAVFLATSAVNAVDWVRGGVVPCHVVEHAAWSIVVPATESTPVAEPYDDALTVLASRHVGGRLAPAIGLFHIDDVAVVTARAAGRSTTRWALRAGDHEVLAGPRLPRLTPEDLHRALASGAGTRGVPVRELRELWGRLDLRHDEWIVEAATILGLPGARVLAGTDTDLGPIIRPVTRSVAAFESVIKDVHE